MHEAPGARRPPLSRQAHAPAPWARRAAPLPTSSPPRAGCVYDTLRKAITDEDAELFRAAVSDVRRASHAPRRPAPPPRIAPIPLKTLQDEQAVLVESLSDHDACEDFVESEDAQVFLRPGLARGILRKLRSGHWVIQSELDLHGLRVDEARQELARFLAEARRHGDRCVRIIHGKGLRSRNREPVLKSKVRGWLRQRDEVLAFVEARPIAGGSGAVVVLLKAVTAR